MVSAVHLSVPATPIANACPRCGAGLLTDTLTSFCPHCGASSQISPPLRVGIRGRPLSAGLVAATLLGIACVIAALVTGMVFSQETLSDWQAVQVWRIQWLLGAIAFFLLGLLLHALRTTAD